MAESSDGDGLIVATVPEDQSKLLCIQYPGKLYTAMSSLN